MNLLRHVFSWLAAEWRLLRLGRRSLREIHFRKYRIAHETSDRFIAERLLRKMPERVNPFAPVTR